MTVQKSRFFQPALAALVLSLALLFAALPAQAANTYEHNPMDNPRAAMEIVPNDDAVYGFSPSPSSVRLADYVDAVDWTNPEQVAALRAEREAYHAQYGELYQLIDELVMENADIETIARTVSRHRNEIRLRAASTPEELALVKKSNLETYGHEEGPLPDELFAKYGDWQTVLDKALSTNPGMDACLGLYDLYYVTYGVEFAATAESQTPPTAPVETPAAPAEPPVEVPTAPMTEPISAEALATPPAPAAGESSYIVQWGDTLGSLAQRFLGNAGQWQTLYELNRETVKNPNLIYPGQMLTLPVPPVDAAVPTAL